MDGKFDYLIIGAGPSALGLCFFLTLEKRPSIIVIERNKFIGGAHGVYRDQGVFSEHSPRVYSSNYLLFRKVLKEMNTDFFEIFKPYFFNISQIGGNTLFKVLTLQESFDLFLEFSFFLFTGNTRNISVGDFMIETNFSKESIDMIDRLCRLTDGASKDNYTMLKFFNLFNQHFFYSLYQPSKPNDLLLFKIWKKYLESKGVVFLLGEEPVDCFLNDSNDKILSVFLKNGSYISGENFVFAINPHSLVKLFTQMKIIDHWKGLEKFSDSNKYIDYKSITFHWKEKLELEKVYGFPESDWGLVFINLSDYMDLNLEKYKGVISIGLTILDRKSKVIDKTVNESREEEIVLEVFRELKQVFGEELKFPDFYQINRDTDNISGFVENTGEFLPFENDYLKNVYTLGVYNGKSKYNFTTLESALQNSLALSKILSKEQDYSNFKQIEIITFRKVFLTILISVVVSLLFIGLIVLSIIFYSKS